MPTPAVASHPYQNQLLSALPHAERDRLVPKLELVTLPLGQVICESNQRIRWGYFLTSSIVSLFYTTENGSTAETALVGNDGVIGTAIFLGGDRSCNRAVVAVAGQSFRIPAMVLLEEFDRTAVLQHVLLRYTHALIAQISQTAVCNRLHSIEQRFCRQLLMCHDRTGSSELMMTQELIAQMLGGRRESVTVAAGHLQDLGLIHYCRGRITILNRVGLEANACECYRIVEDDLARQPGPKQKVRFSQRPAAFEQAG